MSLHRVLLHLVIFTLSINVANAGTIDFMGSFLQNPASISSPNATTSVVDPRWMSQDFSSYIASGFMARPNSGLALSICAQQLSQDVTKAHVVHSQVCRIKDLLIHQCTYFIRCVTDRQKVQTNNAQCIQAATDPDIVATCASISRGLQSDDFYAAYAAVDTHNERIAFLLFLVLSRSYDLIPGRGEDRLGYWLSSINYDLPGVERKLLVMIAILLQRPETLSDTEISKLIRYANSYTENLENLPADQYYTEPDWLRQMGTFDLRGMVLGLAGAASLDE